jgi:hypothetical protein
MSEQPNEQNLTRRKSQDMQNAQVKEKIQAVPVQTPVQSSTTKSRFNDAEYERWNEKIRNRNGSKNK